MDLTVKLLVADVFLGEKFTGWVGESGEVNKPGEPSDSGRASEVS